MPPRGLLDGTRYRHNYPPLAVYIAGEDIEAGSAVCQSRTSPGRIMKAQADDPARMPCIGAILGSKLLGQEAYVVASGMHPRLRKVKDFKPGSNIYVSTERGKFTDEQPAYGTKQICGVARDASSALLYCIPPQVPVSVGYVTRGNHTIKPADGTEEVFFAGEGDPDEYSVPHHGYLWVTFDVSALVADKPITLTGRLYHKIDGTNLRPIARNHVLVGTDEEHLTIGGPVSSGASIRLSLQVDKAVGGDRRIPHVFIQGP